MDAYNAMLTCNRERTYMQVAGAHFLQASAGVEDGWDTLGFLGGFTIGMSKPGFDPFEMPLTVYVHTAPADALPSMRRLTHAASHALLGQAGPTTRGC